MNQIHLWMYGQSRRRSSIGPNYSPSRHQAPFCCPNEKGGTMEAIDTSLQSAGRRETFAYEN